MNLQIKKLSNAVTTLLVVSAAASLGPSSLAADSTPLCGFSPQSAASELQNEKSFRSLPQPENLRQYMQRLAAHPHHVGSAYDKENAEWIQAQMKSWGWDSTIETFQVLFPTPKTRLLEMTEPVRFTARLQEAELSADPTSNQKEEQLPTYNAYSTDGDVTGPLVFVNYGLPDDYKELDRLGVSVKGAIVISKLGHSWRGIKPKVAAQHGAIGCILYSDPRDDGFYADDVFPDGPMRNTNGVQRGSVADFPSTSPGDPLTPGYGAVEGAKRLAVKESKTITSIPVLPISSGDALPLLAQLKGPLAPESWRGALPITYHLGAGPAKVHLKLEFNWDIKPVYDVISRIPGTTASKEWVLRGNHHDGWVNGASDPVSGQICLLEEARSLGVMLKQGWKPRRTLIYCSWDGEEPGLLGSTEWVETHAAELRQHAIAYLNTDDSGRGFLGMSGSHILQNLINSAAKEIPDPEVNTNVWSRSLAAKIAMASGLSERKSLRENSDLPLEAPGSGSDYTAFVDFLGVPILDIGFGGESRDAGVYHSIYDDYYWYSHFGDTNFAYGRALSQTMGTTVLRLADAEVIPYEFNDLASTVHKYVVELHELLKHRQEDIEEVKREISDGVYLAVSDPQHPTAAPVAEFTPPELNFAPLLNADKALTEAAKNYQKAFTKAQPKFGDALLSSKVDQLNQLLLQAERSLTHPDGLPGRPWYKHLLYAPGAYTGYGAKTMPGIREGIELSKDAAGYVETEKEIVRVAKVLETETTLLESGKKILDQLTAP